jgi:hypothetical protein
VKTLLYQKEGVSWWELITTSFPLSIVMQRRSRRPHQCSSEETTRITYPSKEKRKKKGLIHGWHGGSSAINEHTMPSSQSNRQPVHVCTRNTYSKQGDQSSSMQNNADGEAWHTPSFADNITCSRDPRAITYSQLTERVMSSCSPGYRASVVSTRTPLSFK